MLEEEAGVMRNAMTTRAPCGANKTKIHFNSELLILCNELTKGDMHTFLGIDISTNQYLVLHDSHVLTFLRQMETLHSAKRDLVIFPEEN